MNWFGDAQKLMMIFSYLTKVNSVTYYQVVNVLWKWKTDDVRGYFAIIN